ncbi:MAG: hypothetical protein KQH83_11205 [Actinobacteria bacterium]|nr:hypothetical protein [Actinomycetota bacterium]
MEFTIARRFRGPEDSGNGGYTCGMVARFVPGHAEVTLRTPPPLDVPLEVRAVEGGVDVLHDGRLVAEGRAALPAADVPGPATMAEAEAARARYAGYERHAFPTCFVCGTDRAGDGLMIHAGPVEGREVWASPFRPDPTVPAEGGVLAPEIVWSALDCPGAWAVERAVKDRPVVLGRMAAVLERPAPDDGEYVAMGWPIGVEGRKLFSGTVLYGADGTRHGWATQTWIVLA